jgi:hypothetical protein
MVDALAFAHSRAILFSSYKQIAIWLGCARPVDGLVLDVRKSGENPALSRNGDLS